MAESNVHFLILKVLNKNLIDFHSGTESDPEHVLFLHCAMGRGRFIFYFLNTYSQILINQRFCIPWSSQFFNLARLLNPLLQLNCQYLGISFSNNGWKTAKPWTRIMVIKKAALLSLLWENDFLSKIQGLYIMPILLDSFQFKRDLMTNNRSKLKCFRSG